MNNLFKTVRKVNGIYYATFDLRDTGRVVQPQGFKKPGLFVSPAGEEIPCEIQDIIPEELQPDPEPDPEPEP